MFTKHDRRTARDRRHHRTRKRVSGTEQRPRVAIFRSAAHITAQVIDDGRGHTMASASTIEPQLREQLKGRRGVPAAAVVGEVLAQRAKEAGISAVVFDRGGNRYHGRVQALAEAARAAGLEF